MYLMKLQKNSNSQFFKSPVKDKLCQKVVVSMNGQLGRKFVSSRGIRKRDPLSPYLFILLSEVLSRLIHLAVDRGQLMGISMNLGYPVISHMFFCR